MSKPLISVLIPTYKPQSDHLQAALESLINQTEERWQAVICNEPTTVDTKTIIDNYLTDQRFSFYQNPTCLGIGGNWNQCLNHVNTPYVAFLFQDDQWGPGYLAAGLQVLQTETNVGFVSLDHTYQFDGLDPITAYQNISNLKQTTVAGGRHQGHEFLGWWLERELHPNLIGEPPFVMLKQELINKVGPFNESMQQFLDVEYWIRCLLHTDWYYIKEPMGTFRVHPEAASARNRSDGQGILDRFLCFEWLIRNLDKGELKILPWPPETALLLRWYKNTSTVKSVAKP